MPISEVRSEEIVTNPETAWAVGRNDPYILMAGMRIRLYKAPQRWIDKDVVNFSPVSRAGRELVAGFEISSDEALNLAKAILKVLGHDVSNIKPINYVAGSDDVPSTTNGPSDPSSDGG